MLNLTATVGLEDRSAYIDLHGRVPVVRLISDTFERNFMSRNTSSTIFIPVDQDLAIKDIDDE